MYTEIVSRLKGENLRKWKELLSDTKLQNDKLPERTVLIWDGDDLIATGSRDANILKYLSVSPKRQGEDLLSAVITELRKDSFEYGYNHLFLYTKPTNKNIFTSLFFYPIVETSKVLFMENKKNGISDFLKNYSTKKEQGVIGSLVMNCNPFTLGHQYVIEKASKECDEVYVFVLSEESDGFSANDRFQMVKRGTCHLKNVTVLKTGPYLISSATFPTYFLKDRDSVDQIFCEVDIEIFAQYFVPYFGITRRYVGTEPLSPMTDKYNDALKKMLSEKSIEFIEVSRKENQGIPISASEVRRRIKDGDISSLDKLVPASTLEYLLNNNLI